MACRIALCKESKTLMRLVFVSSREMAELQVNACVISLGQTLEGRVASKCLRNIFGSNVGTVRRLKKNAATSPKFWRRDRLFYFFFAELIDMVH